MKDFQDIKIDYKDLLISPAIVSNIKSRKDVNPYYSHPFGNHLPLITAPMDTVVNARNAGLFTNLGINVCYPRGEYSLLPDKSMLGTNIFESVSLSEFEDLIFKDTLLYNNYNISMATNGYVKNFKYYVCIDIANGHMKYLHSLIKTAKNKFGDKIAIMAGNVAHPSTYVLLSNAGADYIRVGIGNGNGCLTTQQTGVGAPMASLVRECHMASLILDKPAQIVADGGIKEYADIFKALALGADYVMIGSLFNQCLESAGPTYLWKFPLDQYGNIAKWLHKNGYTLSKRFRGMSTKEVQKKWGRTQLKTSEGISKIVKVETTLNKWTENFVDYLRTNLSYCNYTELKDFIGNPIINQISEQAFRRFNK